MEKNSKYYKSNEKWEKGFNIIFSRDLSNGKL